MLFICMLFCCKVVFSCVRWLVYFGHCVRMCVMVSGVGQWGQFGEVWGLYFMVCVFRLVVPVCSLVIALSMFLFLWYVLYLCSGVGSIDLVCWEIVEVLYCLCHTALMCFFARLLTSCLEWKIGSVGLLSFNPSLAAWSAFSLPNTPTWAGTQRSCMFLFEFLSVCSVCSICDMMPTRFFVDLFLSASSPLSESETI